MSNISVIIRRVLRKGIRSTVGIEGLVADLIGDDWQMMLSASREQREGLVKRLTEKVERLFRDRQVNYSTALVKEPSTVLPV